MALPRSRTAWLANLLTTRNSFCYHEGMVGCKDVEDLKQKLRDTPYDTVGISDTGIGLFINRLMGILPEVKLIYIERDPDECYKSVRELGIYIERDLFHAQAEHMQKAVSNYKSLHLHYHELDDREAIQELFDYVDIEFDENRYNLLKDLRVETVMANLIQKMDRNTHQIQSLMRSAEVH